MPNCRRPAEHLAYAFAECDRIKTWNGESKGELQLHAENTLSYLEEFFKELGRHPFEGYEHDKTHLMSQVNSERPSPEFVKSYAESLQTQILGQGLLDVIDCQCGSIKRSS